MKPEELLSFRLVQIDIIVCWIIYIFEAMILPAMISILLVVEHKLSKQIRKSKSKWQRKRKRKGDEHE